MTRSIEQSVSQIMAETNAVVRIRKLGQYFVNCSEIHTLKMLADLSGLKYEYIRQLSHRHGWMKKKRQMVKKIEERTEERTVEIVASKEANVRAETIEICDEAVAAWRQQLRDNQVLINASSLIRILELRLQLLGIRLEAPEPLDLRSLSDEQLVVLKTLVQEKTGKGTGDMRKALQELSETREQFTKVHMADGNGDDGNGKRVHVRLAPAGTELRNVDPELAKEYMERYPGSEYIDVKSEAEELENRKKRNGE